MNFYNWSNFFRVVVQPDGKIVTVGNQGAMLPDPNKEEFDYCTWFVARYHNDGSPDSSFGENGKLKTIIRLKATEIKPADDALSVAVQSDGKIVIVGSSEDVSYVDITTIGSPSLDSAIVRYDVSGNLDSSFGSDNNGTIVWQSDKRNFLTDVALQSDNKIVVIGSIHNNKTDKDEFLMARYTPQGLLDESFGDKGIVVSPIGTGDMYAKNIVLQKDGKILITGVASWDDRKQFTLVRYTAQGTLDTTFGPSNNGIITTSIRGLEDKSFAIALQEDDKIIVAGDSLSDKQQYDFVLVRYNAQK